ncbi:MAG: TldD/PmbA family protein [bacterium]
MNDAPFLQGLIEYGEIGCRASLSAGADQAEAFVQNSRVIEVEVEAGSLRCCDAKEDPGLCVRAFRGGGVGFSRVSRIAEEEVKAAGVEAAGMARHAQPDPDFRTLPPPMKHVEVAGLYDREIADLKHRTAIQWAEEIIEAGKETAPDAIIRAGVRLAAGSACVVNSLGAAAEERFTSAHVYVFAVIRRNGSAASFYDFSRARSLGGVESRAELARRTVRRALSYLDSRKIRSGAYTVVLGPLASAELFEELCGAASAENVQRKRSYLVGKKGKKIAADTLSIADDGTVPGGIGSSPFDGEGVPHRRFVFVDGGTLAGFFHNSYTSGKSGEPNTAHASRGGYHSSVGIGHTNIRASTGARTEKEIISPLNEAIYIESSSLSPNPATGDFSATVDYGWKIEKGELAYPVANTMIGGNVLDVIAGIEEISKDYRDDAGNVFPSLLIGRLNVAGAGG